MAQVTVAGGSIFMVSRCNSSGVQNARLIIRSHASLSIRIAPHNARVIGDGLVTALRTGIDMTAQRSRAAALNGAKGLELLKVKAPSIPIQEAVALRTEDVGHLHGGPVHFCLWR
jgi:hypothetical protein